jgi:hypothetical protein
MEAPASVTQWMYSTGPRERDLVQLQWMRVDGAASRAVEIPSPLDLNVAALPLVLDPLDALLPPLFIDAVGLQQQQRHEEPSAFEGPRSRAQEATDATAAAAAAVDRAFADKVASYIATLAGAGDATATAAPSSPRPQQQHPRLDDLRDDEWRRVLGSSVLFSSTSTTSTTSTATPLLSALRLAALLDALHPSPAAERLARALLRVDCDALPRALCCNTSRKRSRDAAKSGKGPPSSSSAAHSSTAYLRSASSLKTMAHLAAALLRSAPHSELAGLPPEQFRHALTQVSLRERAGEAGIDLETSLAEVYFARRLSYAHGGRRGF